MKRRMCALFALLLTVSGCEKMPSVPAEGAWYLRGSKGEYTWQQEAFTPSAEELVNQCMEVLDALQNPPEGLRAALPIEVSVRSLKVASNVVYVNFSAEYAALSAGDRSIACAAVVHSLLHLKGLRYVSVSAEGTPQSPTFEQYCTLETFVLE